MPVRQGLTSLNSLPTNDLRQMSPPNVLTKLPFGRARFGQIRPIWLHRLAIESASSSREEVTGGAPPGRFIPMLMLLRRSGELVICPNYGSAMRASGDTAKTWRLGLRKVDSSLLAEQSTAGAVGRSHCSPSGHTLSLLAVLSSHVVNWRLSAEQLHPSLVSRGALLETAITLQSEE